MSFALRPSIGKVCGAVVPVARFSQRTAAIRATSVKRSLQVRAMSAQSDTKLDKNTPDSKWKEILSAEEYHILRQKGTEPAGAGKYNKVYDDGVYKCGGCGTPLYKSETKFDSGCGWPAYWDNIPGAVDRHEDNAYGMKRIEITCSNCGGHLGHVFEGEKFGNPKNERHCVNSKSVKFDPKK
ncbi:TPA: Peptide methionine sulfoxide reductase B2, chloroplastic [Trebouxia sp. C0004]